MDTNSKMLNRDTADLFLAQQEEDTADILLEQSDRYATQERYLRFMQEGEATYGYNACSGRTQRELQSITEELRLLFADSIEDGDEGENDGYIAHSWMHKPEIPVRNWSQVAIASNSLRYDWAETSRYLTYIRPNTQTAIQDMATYKKLRFSLYSYQVFLYRSVINRLLIDGLIYFEFDPRRFSFFYTLTEKGCGVVDAMVKKEKTQIHVPDVKRFMQYKKSATYKIVLPANDQEYTTAGGNVGVITSAMHISYRPEVMKDMDFLVLYISESPLYNKILFSGNQTPYFVSCTKYGTPDTSYRAHIVDAHVHNSAAEKYVLAEITREL